MDHIIVHNLNIYSKKQFKDILLVYIVNEKKIASNSKNKINKKKMLVKLKKKPG
jgi:hypothetical protein